MALPARACIAPLGFWSQRPGACRPAWLSYEGSTDPPLAPQGTVPKPPSSPSQGGSHSGDKGSALSKRQHAAPPHKAPLGGALLGPEGPYPPRVPEPLASLHNAWDVQGPFLGREHRLKARWRGRGLPAPPPPPHPAPAPSVKPHSPVRVLSCRLGIEPDVAVHIEEHVVLRQRWNSHPVE